MEKVLFERELKYYTHVAETTTYLEMLTYSDGKIECSQGPLPDEDFEDFVYRRGAFAPRATAEGLNVTHGLRFVLQLDAQHPDTFAPRRATVKPDNYRAMMKGFHLPSREIETSALVGPCFVASYETDESEQYLQVVFRKSGIAKKSRTRGWEIMLSHQISTGITSGLVKGSASSDIAEVIEIVTHTECRRDIGHPMLLPIIALSLDLSSKVDMKTREARNWLRRLENALTLRDEVIDSDAYAQFDMDLVGRDLVECTTQALWKPAKIYLEIIRNIEGAMARFKSGLAPERMRGLDKLHESMLGRLEFLKAKLTCIDYYNETTLHRLELQRDTLQRIIGERDSKVSSEMTRLAHAGKKDSTAMKTLSLLSALFLPGTFVASLLSMSFFDFHVGDGSDAESGGEEVSRKIWIYFAVTVPLTLSMVGVWWFFNSKRQQRTTVDHDVEQVQMDVLRQMRQRTMSKFRR